MMKPPPIVRPPTRRSTGLTEWFRSLEVGGPYDIPAHLSEASAKAMTANGRIPGKTFCVRTGADRVMRIYRLS